MLPGDFKPFAQMRAHGVFASKRVKFYQPTTSLRRHLRFESLSEGREKYYLTATTQFSLVM